MPRRTDISSILIIGGAVAACTSPSIPDRQPLMSRQGQLRAIADRCGLSIHALSLDEAGDIHFRPSPDTRYEVVDCALVQLRERGLAEHMPMAFVGNEAPAEEVGNHASPH